MCISATIQNTNGLMMGLNYTEPINSLPHILLMRNLLLKMTSILLTFFH